MMAMATDEGDDIKVIGGGLSDWGWVGVQSLEGHNLLVLVSVFSHFGNFVPGCDLWLVADLIFYLHLVHFCLRSWRRRIRGSTVVLFPFL